MDVDFCTSNLGKLREARGILGEYGLRVRPLHRKLPEPQADTLLEVVRAKLAGVPSRPHPVLVEDSGLFLEGLAGFPGVYSAYIYRIWGFPPILELLRRRPRGAVFRTVAGVRRGRVVRYFVGECRGTLAAAPRGSHGFGFDPLFIPVGSTRTFAEMAPAEKWTISHRGRALRSVGEFLVPEQRSR
ncbi:MAG: non-canonical purine NTP pyrophosphatase [Thermoplasmata archaeon]|nr:non-canonical purine NTP pyrophosphatase [Thermoplasmata archaeon]